MKRNLRLATALTALLLAPFPVLAKGSVKKAQNKIDFINHVETGIDVAAGVHSVKKVGNTLEDGYNAGDAKELGKDLGGDLVRHEVRDGFFDVVENQIGGDIAEDVTKKGTKKAAKKAVKKH